MTVPKDWEGRVLLHFGAVDDETTVSVNGVPVARHQGGYTGFTVDLTAGEQPVRPGETFTLGLRVVDEVTLGKPSGKQAVIGPNLECKYDSITGNWGEVWMEAVPEHHLGRPSLEADLTQGCFWMQQDITGNRTGAWRSGMFLRVTLSDDRGVITTETVPAESRTSLQLRVPPGRQRVWSPEDPHLMTVDVQLLDADPGVNAGASVLDHIRTEAGLRSISCEGSQVLLNGEPVRWTGVLDQGLDQDGPVPPSREAMKRRLLTMKALGFDLIRLHQTRIPEQYLSLCDQVGLVVMADWADWGWDGRDSNFQPLITYAAQFTEMVLTARSHPCVVAWVPFNERNNPPQTDRIALLEAGLAALFLIADKLGGDRLIVLNSGGPFEVFADTPNLLVDAHCYEQVPDIFQARVQDMLDGRPSWARGRPFLITEVGGLGYQPGTALLTAPSVSDSAPFAYGDAPQTPAQFYAAMEAILGAAWQSSPPIVVYTQALDTGNEVNGLCYSDGTPKFPPAVIAGIVREARTRGVVTPPHGISTRPPGARAPASLPPAAGRRVIPLVL